MRAQGLSERSNSTGRGGGSRSRRLRGRAASLFAVLALACTSATTLAAPASFADQESDPTVAATQEAAMPATQSTAPTPATSTPDSQKATGPAVSDASSAVAVPNTDEDDSDVAEAGQPLVSRVFATDATPFAAIPVSDGVQAQMAGHRGYSGKNGSATSSNNTIRYGSASNTTTTGTISNSGGTSGGISPWTGYTGWVSNGTTAYSAHGCSSGGNCSSLNLSQQSALGFAPASVSSIETGQIFNLGRMVHRNNPVQVTDDWFRGNMNIKFLGMNLSYQWRLNETPNNAHPNSNSANDDYVDFLNQVSDQTFTQDGLTYTLVVHGFRQPNADGTCPPVVTDLSSVKNQFRTTEGTSTYGCLYASVDQVRNLNIKKIAEGAGTQDFSFTAQSSLAGSSWSTGGNDAFTLKNGATRSAKYTSGEELTVTETALPDKWQLNSVSCIDGSGNSVPGVTVNKETKSLVIPEGTVAATKAASDITCTFTNTKTQSPPLTCSEGTTGSNWLINQASTSAGGGIYTNKVEWVDPTTGVKTPIATLSDASAYGDAAITRETNGLGISSDGRYVYLVDFNISPTDNPNPKVYQYDVVEDKITSFPAANNSSDAEKDNYRTRRGGVDLSTGIYYYSTSADPASTTHYLYALNPVSGESWYVGKVNTQHSGQSGDLAFDDQGNMYFVVGNNNLAYVNVYNGQLPTTPSDPKINVTLRFLNQVGNSGSNTGNGVGIAYGPDGYLYVSNTAGGVYKVDPSTGSFGAAGGTLGGSGSTVDLGTCVSPSTLSVAKELPDGRTDQSDQFTLSAYRGTATGPNTGTQVGQSVTTNGPDTGKQTNQVGPVPILTGSSNGEYWIRETASGFSSFAGYDTSYTCKDDNDASWTADGKMTQTGNQRQAKIGAIPSAAAGKSRAIDCTITNEPLPKLTLVKDVDNPANGDASFYAMPADWTLTATGGGVPATTITGTTGTVAVTSKRVPAGSYDLSEAWKTADTKAKGDAYDLSKLVCTNKGIAMSDPSTGSKSVTLGYGDDVICTLTNTPETGSVTWSKVDENGKVLSDSEWKITGPAGSGSAELAVKDCVKDNPSECTGADKNPDGGAFKVNDLSWGKYTLTETKAPAGYELDTSKRAFTIDYTLTAKFEGNSNSFVNVQRTGPSLPLTGGVGREFYAILGGGILLIGGAAAAYVLKRRRNNA